jgi:hypothetical protein
MPIFDAAALALRQSRARRRGESFLDARIWDEIAERIAVLSVTPRTALLLGPTSDTARNAAKATGIILTAEFEEAGAVDLVLAVRWAETENDLAEKLAALAVLLPPNIPVLGASLGGDSLRSLRTALVEADRANGTVVPRSHPRIEPGAFAELLQRAGFATPVVDVETVEARYSSLRRLVEDLRDLGATSVLADRPRTGVGRMWRDRLDHAFPAGTVERFDIVHFAAWTAAR